MAASCVSDRSGTHAPAALIEEEAEEEEETRRRWAADLDRVHYPSARRTALEPASHDDVAVPVPPASQRQVDAAGKTTAAVVAELGLSGDRPVVVVIGGAGNLPPDVGKRMLSLLEQGLAPVLDQRDAVIFTGGTNSGLMAITGSAFAATRATLVGVSPTIARMTEVPPVTLDPHHDIQVLTGGSTWGSESALLLELARAVAGEGPRLVVLANGGPTSVEEVNRFLDDGWPILAITGSGGAADDLVRRVDDNSSSTMLWHHVEQQAVETYAISASAYGLTKLVDWRLEPNALIKQAWISYVEFDQTAARQRRANTRFRSILGAGTFIFVGLIAARLQYQLVRGADKSSAGDGSARSVAFHDIVASIAIALPIALAVAAALSDTIAADRGWHLMRGAAEAVKREIFRYRSSVGDTVPNQKRAAVRLKSVLDVMTEQCAVSGVLLVGKASVNSARPPSLDEGDDEIGRLTATSYLMHRANHQLLWYRNKGSGLRRHELRMIALSALLAAISGALATTLLAPWATVLVLGATGIAAYLERSRLRARAIQYARTAAQLAAVLTWWSSLATAETQKARTFQSLVERTEDILEAENVQWRGVGSGSQV